MRYSETGLTLHGFENEALINIWTLEALELVEFGFHPWSYGVSKVVLTEIVHEVGKWLELVMATGDRPVLLPESWLLS
jgi:hypothetical protein